MSNVTELRRRDRPDGRIPPHNLDAEESLLGAMLLSSEARDTASEIGLAADAFYKPAHGHIYDTLVRLHEAGQPADPVTVADHLRRVGLLDEVGGDSYILHLQAGTPATSNADRYARIVHEHALLRKLIAVAGEIAELGYSLPDDVAEAVDRAQALTLDISATSGQHGTVSRLTDLYASHLDILEARAEGRHPLGVPTGLRSLDNLIGGLGAGQLITVAARPAVGKTAIGLAFALGAAGNGTPSLFVSIEMSTTELADRLTAAASRVPLDKIRAGALAPKDWASIGNASTTMTLPVLIDDDAAATIASIRSTVRRHRSDDIGLVIVDYLQIIDPSNRTGDRRVDVDEIARGLKRLARQLNIPVVALAQLNRSLEQRHDKRPMLSDLRESGQIEAESDVVIGLYRDEIYKPDTPDRGVLELHVLKQRNGPTGIARVAFHGEQQRITDMARETI